MKYLAAAALLLLGTSGVTLAQESAAPAAEPKPWDTCVSCHGADGNSVNPIWPSLAGQGAPYIAKQLHDFKGGRRADPLMSGMAMAVQDADLPRVPGSREVPYRDYNKIFVGEGFVFAKCL